MQSGQYRVTFRPFYNNTSVLFYDSLAEVVRDFNYDPEPFMEIDFGGSLVIESFDIWSKQQ